MGRFPAHRPAGWYRMSLIRLVFVLGLLFIASPFIISNAHAVVPSWLTGATGATVYADTGSACSAAWTATGGNSQVRCPSGGNYCWTYAGASANFLACNSNCAGTGCSVSVGAFTSLSGSCVAGYTYANGACTPSAGTCATPINTVTRSGYFALGTDSSGANFAGNPCLSSCTNTFYVDSLWSVLVNGVKNYYFKGYFRVTGAGPNGNSCSPDTANAPTPSAGVPAPTCPAGQSVGYVNGIPLCYTPTTPPPAGAAPPVTTTTTTATTTGPDGSTTKTDTVNNADGSKTITTVVTDPSGNKQTTTQQVKPTDPVQADQFCQQNPDAEVCKKKSECEKNPKAVGCLELGDNPATEDIGKRDIPITFTPVAISENATCPAPINISIAGHPISIKYDGLCMFAAGIRPVFLAMAYLSAALIMIGGIRENA